MGMGMGMGRPRCCRARYTWGRAQAAFLRLNRCPARRRHPPQPFLGEEGGRPPCTTGFIPQPSQPQCLDPPRRRRGIFDTDFLALLAHVLLGTVLSKIVPFLYGARPALLQLGAGLP
jgi:hypothetical protein